MAQSGEEQIILLTEGITKGLLDCDTASFVVLAIAHELDWPVFLVDVPHHMFVRWDDGSNRFNMDWGTSVPDRRYKKRYNISAESIKYGIYLKSFGQDEIWAYNLVTRAGARTKRGDLKGAIADCTEVLKQNPDMPGAYGTRGNAKFELGDLKGAVADYTEAIKLNPNEYLAYNNRGNAKAKGGDLKGAIADYTEAIKLKPNYSAAYRNRGVAYKKLGRRREAIEDFYKAELLESKR